MKTYRITSGPFTERPFYSAEEIEQLCADELRGVDLLPITPEAIRIDRFVEKRFKIYPAYEVLPNGVLGFIEFGSDSVKGITISRALSEEDSKVAERRIRTTLAHEAGHALLHTHLFVLGQKLDSLFGKELDPDKPKILCRDGAVQGTQGFKTKGNPWWEYQANLVIGPLLLPMELVMTALESFLERKGMLGYPVMNRDRQDEAIKSLAETFDVNPVVAKIRIDTLFPKVQDFQLTL